MGQKVESLLSEDQKKFLEIIQKEDRLTSRFYLTGGTALAEFYLKHRYSEDIDLFCEMEFTLAPLRGFIKKAAAILGVEKVDYRNFLGLHTFFLYCPNSKKLKVDFNYYPFPRIERGVKFGKLAIDSELDIAANKVHTIAMKPRARDFIDLYFLIKEKKYEMKHLLNLAKSKFDWHIDPIQLGSRLFMAKDAKDFPKMIKKINHQEWQDFFVEESRKLKSQIFK